MLRCGLNLDRAAVEREPTVPWKSSWGSPVDDRMGERKKERQCLNLSESFCFPGIVSTGARTRRCSYLAQSVFVMGLRTKSSQIMKIK